MDLPALLTYHREANLKALDSVAVLGPDAFVKPVTSSFTSLRATLVHMFMADRVWQGRVIGVKAEMPRDDDYGSATDLRAAWVPVLDAWFDVVQARPADTVVEYRRLSSPDPRRNSLDRIVLHVMNHGSYHRGQLATLTRQLGGSPVKTDLLG